jgi:hypothetical protein
MEAGRPTERDSQLSARRKNGEFAPDAPAFLVGKSDRLVEEGQRSGSTVGRGALAIFIVLVIVSGAFTTAALIQVRSLKSELSRLQRETLSLNERVARLDLIVRSQKQAIKDADPKDPPTRQEAPADKAPLLLSRDEVQLIRDYIKPAPIAGASPALPNVGDPIGLPTIAFPSAVTEKVPKLLGARFAIKDGAILIVRRDSRLIDAVLGPN